MMMKTLTAGPALCHPRAVAIIRGGRGDDAMPLPLAATRSSWFTDFLARTASKINEWIIQWSTTRLRKPAAIPHAAYRFVIVAHSRKVSVGCLWKREITLVVLFQFSITDLSLHFVNGVLFGFFFNRWIGYKLLYSRVRCQLLIYLRRGH